jgi:zinc protease
MNRSSRFPVLVFFLAVLQLYVFSARAAAASDVTRATLDNGLRVVIVADHLAPVVAVQVNYLAGSNEAPTGFPGTAHALEHMMFRGSPGLTADQLATIMAALGGESNADTQQTVTQYFVTTPVEMLETALRVEAIRMRGVLATDDLWDKERGAIEQEVTRDLSDPLYLFHTRLLAKMFAGTPFALDALGDKPSFDKTSGSMLRKFHEQWYGPNNAILFIVGDVEAETSLAMTKHLFADIPRRPVPNRPQGELHPLSPAKLDMETNLPYGLAVVAYRLPGYDNPDYAAGRILGDVLDSQRARLYDLVTGGAALSAGFSNEEFAPATLGYAAAAFPRGSDGAALVMRLKKIVNDYRQDGIPADLVTAAKAREIAAAQFAKNSTEGLAFAWAEAVAVEGRTSPDDDIEAIRRVTPADVNRVARKYLLQETAVTAVLTPRPAGMPIAGTGMKGKEHFAPREVNAVKLPSWAKGLRELKVPAAPPMPREFRLDNGLRLLVLSTDVSPTVSLYGEVRNRPEMQEPAGREGVSAILAELFSYGTTSLDRLAYQKALDEIAASATAGTDFSLEILADKFERGVALLADNLLRPALPGEAFDVIQQEQAASLAGKRQSPDYHAKRAMLVALFPADDPTIREATPETVQAIDLDDVKDYYKHVFRPDMTTIVIIGQIAPEEALRVINMNFGAWRTSGVKPDLDLPAVPPNKPSEQVVPDPDRVQDLVMLAQVGNLTRKSADYYPLQVGMHVLTGGFYATRFYRDLREETGLVYTVDGHLHAGPNRSVLTVSYGCDPENVSRAREIIVRDLQTMQQQEVSSDELLQAKTLILRRIPLSQSSFTGIAEQYLALVRGKLPLDEQQKAAQRITGISAGEVREAFVKRIRPDDLVQVTQGPTPK